MSIPEDPHRQDTIFSPKGSRPGGNTYMDVISTHDFYYDLPKELIAQTPAERRDSSRLLVVDRKTGTLTHRRFYDIIDYLNPGDVLVINDSKVIPARLYGEKIREEAAPEPPSRVEFLLLKQHELDVWEVLVHPGKRLKKGARVSFSGILTAEITDITEGGNRIVRFSYDTDKYDHIFSVLHEIGTMPLPPYITETLKDQDRYQTVYAKREGSAAAPTAGLHFTKELLERIRAKGVLVVPVLLHVGLGTFRPVKVENAAEHQMHTEYFSVSPESAEIINRARAAGGRVIAVGTTSTRTIESASGDDGILCPRAGDTDIFIYPGYRFKMTDALITNFHLPESTLMMLVSALAGRELIMKAYEEAIKEKYRFFSFGDAMFIQ